MTRSPTHHVLLVLLEVCVDKKAAGGVIEGILHVVDTLVPAGCQRGGSRGHLLERDGRCAHAYDSISHSSEQNRTSVSSDSSVSQTWPMTTFQTHPCKVQVSVEEAAAEGGDPGEHRPPLHVVGNSPENRAAALSRCVAVCMLCSLIAVAYLGSVPSISLKSSLK